MVLPSGFFLATADHSLHRGGRSEASQTNCRQSSLPGPAAASAFYRDISGLDLLMDRGRIATYASSHQMSVQVSFASERAPERRFQACRSRSMMSMRHTQPCALPVSKFATARPASRGAYANSMFATPGNAGEQPFPLGMNAPCIAASPRAFVSCHDPRDGVRLKS